MRRDVVQSQVIGMSKHLVTASKTPPMTANAFGPNRAAPRSVCCPRAWDTRSAPYGAGSSTGPPPQKTSQKLRLSESTPGSGGRQSGRRSARTASDREEPRIAARLPLAEELPHLLGELQPGRRSPTGTGHERRPLPADVGPNEAPLGIWMEREAPAGASRVTFFLPQVPLSFDRMLCEPG